MVISLRVPSKPFLAKNAKNDELRLSTRSPLTIKVLGLSELAGAGEDKGTVIFVWVTING